MTVYKNDVTGDTITVVGTIVVVLRNAFESRDGYRDFVLPEIRFRFFNRRGLVFQPYSKPPPTTSHPIK